MDLLAWVPAGDKANSLLVFFGQCGCGKNWDAKQQEIAPSSWEQFFLLKHKNNSLVFIPYYLRDNEGDWPEPQKISCFLLDRLRILRFTGKPAQWASKIPAAVYEEVDDVLKQDGFIVG